jgi:hypothetical protein
MMSKQEEEERISYILESLKDEELRHLLTEYRQNTNPVVLMSILSHLNISMKNDAIGAIIPQFKLNEPNEIILGGIVLQGQLYKVTLRVYGDIDSEAQILITKESSIDILVMKND